MKKTKVLLLFSMFLLHTIWNESTNIIDGNIIENFDTHETTDEDKNQEISLEEYGYFCQEDKEIEPDEIKKSKIEFDKYLLGRINKINSGTLNLKSEIRELGGNGEAYDIGKELKLVKYMLWGNYLNFEIRVIEYKKKIIEYEIIYKSFEPVFSKHYYKEIEVETICHNNQLSYRKWNMKNLNSYQTVFKNSYWYIPDYNKYSRKIEALAFFTDYSVCRKETILLNHVKWKYWTKAMDHLRYLILNEDLCTLIKILNSPNREGRIIAAVTLNYLQKKKNIKLNKTVEKTIEETFILDGTSIRTGLDLCHWGMPAKNIDFFTDIEKFLLER